MHWRFVKILHWLIQSDFFLQKIIIVLIFENASFFVCSTPVRAWPNTTPFLRVSNVCSQVFWLWSVGQVVLVQELLHLHHCDWSMVSESLCMWWKHFEIDWDRFLKVIQMSSFTKHSNSVMLQHRFLVVCFRWLDVVLGF